MTKEEAAQRLKDLFYPARGKNKCLGYIEAWLSEDDETAFDMAIEALSEQQIIECGNCIHYTPLGKDDAWGRCNINGVMCQLNDYCSWAERREA